MRTKPASLSSPILGLGRSLSRSLQLTLGLSAAAAALLMTGCDAGGDMTPAQMMTQTPTMTPPENTGKPGPMEAFLHDETIGDVFADGNQLPQSKAVRVHACGKIRYNALRNVLATRGVNVDTAMDPDSAGALFRSGNLVLGVANFSARVPVADRNTTGGMTRLFDILIASADELIAGMPARAECMVGGKAASLFNGDATCNADGFTCLLGMPVTDTQMSLCSGMVKDFGADVASVATGKRLAVATLAAPVFLCE